MARQALDAQQLAWRAIERAGGHPGFLERAEIAAASPEKLAAFLESESGPGDDQAPST
ncbi:MAG TPA: hypothetical protein VH478_17855 [Trebonia sp.]|nr:hypothetical protein [Trebonia sp.]